MRVEPFHCWLAKWIRNTVRLDNLVEQTIGIHYDATFSFNRRRFHEAKNPIINNLYQINKQN